MKRAAAIVILALALAGCGKSGDSVKDWAQVELPPNCVAKQIAAEGRSNVVVLCEDGRLFQ